MAYCRWSSDGFRCDVYCYENVSGAWTTHVAGNRITSELPEQPSFQLLQDDPYEWTRRNDAYSAALDAATRAPIGLPHDCETFDDAGPQEMAERLRYLRGLGYHVPDYVFEMLAEETAQSGGNTR